MSWGKNKGKGGFFRLRRSDRKGAGWSRKEFWKKKKVRPKDMCFFLQGKKEQKVDSVKDKGTMR